MLLLKKIQNICESIGYARAASALATQGYYAEAQALMEQGSASVAKEKQAIDRLARVKKAKSSYEPGDHYFKGKKVAFWRGHADA